MQEAIQSGDGVIKWRIEMPGGGRCVEYSCTDPVATSTPQRGQRYEGNVSAITTSACCSSDNTKGHVVMQVTR